MEIKCHRPVNHIVCLGKVLSCLLYRKIPVIIPGLVSYKFFVLVDLFSGQPFIPGGGLLFEGIFRFKIGFV